MESLRTVETGQINSMREEIEKAKRFSTLSIFKTFYRVMPNVLFIVYYVNFKLYSEIVFDKDLWSKNEAELNEKIDDRCRDEKSEREALSKKRENIRVCSIIDRA